MRERFEETDRLEYVDYEAKIVQFMQKRHSYTPSQISTIRRRFKKLPKVTLPPTYTTLFDSAELWTDIGETLVAPADLIKSVIKRKGGDQIDPKLFSVFWANQKDKVFNNWNIISFTSFSKQRHQFWDKDYVTAVLTNILYCNQHQLGIKNKISYNLAWDIPKKDLIEMKHLSLKNLFG